MLRRILVASDLGPSSEPALLHALQLAKEMDADVIVMYVDEPALETRPWYQPVIGAEREIVERVARREREMIQEAMAKQVAAAQTAVGGGVRVATEVRIGAPADVIPLAAKELRMDLVVTGTHGRKGLPHLLLGSVAERIVRHAPCPVLTIRAQ